MKYYTKDELLALIDDDSFVIYENEYNTILKIANEMDNRLFVKVFEEIALGNLSWRDFVTVFNDDSFTDVMTKSIKSQYEFNERYTMFLKYINELNTMYNNMFNDSLVTLAAVPWIDDNSRLKHIVDTEKKNKIYSLFLSRNTNPLNDIYRNKLLADVLNDKIDIDDVLLSIDDYIVPIDFDNIELLDNDIEYAKNNNLSLDDVKKAKSLALYFAALNSEKEDTE